MRGPLARNEALSILAVFCLVCLRERRIELRDRVMEETSWPRAWATAPATNTALRSGTLVRSNAPLTSGEVKILGRFGEGSFHQPRV